MWRNSQETSNSAIAGFEVIDPGDPFAPRTAGRATPHALDCQGFWPIHAVDRHVMQGHGEQPAIIYDSPLAGQQGTLTYRAENAQ